jgi:hypothetical protein
VIEKCNFGDTYSAEREGGKENAHECEKLDILSEFVGCPAIHHSTGTEKLQFLARSLARGIEDAPHLSVPQPLPSFA